LNLLGSLKSLLSRVTYGASQLGPLEGFLLWAGRFYVW